MNIDQLKRAVAKMDIPKDALWRPIRPNASPASWGGTRDTHGQLCNFNRPPFWLGIKCVADMTPREKDKHLEREIRRLRDAGKPSRDAYRSNPAACDAAWRQLNFMEKEDI